jgi:hypothetical protein
LNISGFPAKHRRRAAVAFDAGLRVDGDLFSFSGEHTVGVALADCLPEFVYAPAIGHVMLDDYFGHDVPHVRPVLI